MIEMATSVSGCGTFGSGGITTASTGSTTITVSIPSLGLAATSRLTVVPDRLVAVILKPAAKQLSVGEYSGLSATGRMLSGGAVIYLPARLSWSSGDTSVATVVP